MPLVLADRVRETTTTTGQGTVTLAGAVTGFQSFSVVGDGNTTYYCIANPGVNEWEVGIGTYTASGTTLSRDTVLASSAGAPTKTTFSSGTKDVFVTYPAGESIADGKTNVIEVTDNTNPALRITQLGTGNALVVEDSANPDNSPFVVDASGRTIIGALSSTSTSVGTPQLQLQGTSPSLSSAGVYQFSADTGGPTVLFSKSRGAIGAFDIVSSGDVLGTISFLGADGTALVRGAAISSVVDGTPGTNDMPSRLVFSTAADGASTPTERMRIDNQGRIGIGTSSLSGYSLRVSRTSDASSFVNIGSTPTTSSAATSSYGFYSTASTASNAGTPYTVTNIRHYDATQGTFNVDSTVSNQYGFIANSTLTGATNNVGFYGNIAAGTGRWNFYANGTAANYFAGNVGIGTTTTTDATLNVVANTSTDAVRITQTGAGNALVVEDDTNPDSSPFVVTGTGNVGIGANSPLYQLDVRNSAGGATISAQASTGNAVLRASSLASGAGQLQLINSAGTQSIVGGVGSVNNLVFNVNSTERMRLDSAGNVGIGTTAPSATLNVVANTSTDAVRITQTGAGNALVVEDDTNPDASPFVVDSSGSVVIGTTAALNVGGIQSTKLQIHGFGGSPSSGAALVNWNSVGTQAPIFYMSKSLGGAINTRGAVTDGTLLSRISSTGDDGTTFVEAARIDVIVDGTPGTNDMPGRLVFSTTADGASVPTGRMRINSAGDIDVLTAGARITGDFSNSTVADRVMFQNNTGTFTDIGALAPSSSTQSTAWTAYLGNDPSNTSRMRKIGRAHV
jgi:hypothetical protein